MPPMNKNHTMTIGANEKPTLSVPNLWTEKRMIKIAIEIPTTAPETIHHYNVMMIVPDFVQHAIYK